MSKMIFIECIYRLMNSEHHTRSLTDDGSNQAGPTSIPVVQEQLEIDTVTEHTGTVRVRKVTRHGDESVTLTGSQERVDIERVRVDRPVRVAEPSREESGVLIVPVYEERLVKQLYLVEEIHVRRSRETVQSQETVTLRQEEIIVERFDPEARQWVLDSS